MWILILMVMGTEPRVSAVSPPYKDEAACNRAGTEWRRRSGADGMKVKLITVCIPGPEQQ